MTAKRNLKVGAGGTASQSSPRRRKAPASKTVVVIESDCEQSVAPYDETLLESARTQWQFGDWENLANIKIDVIQHHPQRAKLALLAAAGHFQNDDQNEAHRYIRLAQDWGCSRKLIAQLLISGTHNALGCAAAILGQQTRSEEHFRNAVRSGGVPGDVNLLTRARSAWQLKRDEIG